jgi:hypothetical protein
MANELFGARDTYSGVAGLRKLDIRDDILRYDPNLAPLTVISGRLDSKPTVNPEFKWYEKDRPTRRTTTTSTGTGTTLTMADQGLFQEHDIWKNTVTGENMRVVSTAGTSGSGVVTFVRGASPVACTSGDEFLRVGAAQQEGDTSKPPRSYNPTSVTNYTQITRTPYAATRTWQQSERLLRGTDWQEIADDAMREHLLDLEASKLWGVPREITTGEHPRRETGGAYYFIDTNVTDMGGAMTEAEFFDAFGDVFRHGSTTKTAFSGTLPISVINGYARGKLEVVQADNDDTYGVSISKFRQAGMTLNFVMHRLLDDSTTYENDILILDFNPDGKNLIRQRYLTGGDYGSSNTHVREHIEENDRDGRKDEVLTEDGLEFGLEKAHALFTNITS